MKSTHRRPKTHDRRPRPYDLIPGTHDMIFQNQGRIPGVNERITGSHGYRTQGSQSHYATCDLIYSAKDSRAKPGHYV